MTVNQRSIEWLLTPKALVLVLLYQLYFSFRHWRHFDQLLRVVTGAFFLFLVLSTSIFPWYTVNKLNLPLVNLIQFPFRFFVPATVLLLLAAAMVLDRYFDKKWSKLVTLGLLVVNVLSLAQLSQLQMEKIDEYYNTKHPIQRKKHTFIWGNPADVRASFYDSDKFKLLDIVSKSTPDYLPTNKSNKDNKYVLYEEFVLGHTGAFKKTLGDNKLTLTWTADVSDWAIIPVVKYKDTQLTLNGKKLSDKDYTLSGIGTPTVMQKAGKNTLTITYHISAWFKPLIVVNILSWIVTVAYILIRRIKD